MKLVEGTISQAIHRKLDDTSYDAGTIERLQERVSNLMDIVSSLIQELAEEKNIKRAFVQDHIHYRFELEE